MPDYNQMLYFEVHSVEGIQNYFTQGGDPNEEYDGVSLFTTLVEMYTRTPRFKDCVKVFVENNNHSMDMLNLLLEHSADLTITVKGLIWGRGYEWETWIPSVNPISYCMMGLLPQMHRKETTIASISSL